MDNILNIYSPVDVAKNIAKKMRERRLYFNLTQAALAKKSGVSLGSLKRFENSAEISLKNLLQLAITLEVSEQFLGLFEVEKSEGIDEILKKKKTKLRKRARNNA